MPKIARRRLAREIVRIIAQKPSYASTLLRQVAAYLLQTRQASQSHLLVADIADELLRTKGVLSAEVTTAFGLSNATRQQLTDLLIKSTGATSVELNEQTDASLIGGVVVRTSQLELDASVKRQLMQMAGGIK